MPIWDFANSFSQGVTDGRTHKRSLMQLQLQRDRLNQEGQQFDQSHDLAMRDFESINKVRKATIADTLADNKREDAALKQRRLEADRDFKRQGEWWEADRVEVTMDGTKPGKFGNYDGKLEPGQMQMSGSLAAQLLRDANTFTYNSMVGKAQSDHNAWLRQRSEDADKAGRLGLAAIGQYAGSERAGTVDYVPGGAFEDYRGKYADPTAVGDDQNVSSQLQAQNLTLFGNEVERVLQIVGSDKIPVMIDGKEQYMNMGDLLRADPGTAQRVLSTIIGSAGPSTPDYHTIFGVEGTKQLFDKYGHLRQYGLFPGMDDNGAPMNDDSYNRIVGTTGL